MEQGAIRDGDPRDLRQLSSRQPTPRGAPTDESKDVPAYNEACQGLAEALSENADKASTGKWPANVKDEMDRFEVALKEEREGLLDCQNAKTYKDVEAGIVRWRENSADEEGMELYDLLGGFD